MKRRTLLRGIAASGGLAAFGPARAASSAVKIGVLTDMNGPSRDMSGSGSVAAARLAVEDAGGSALGQPIQLVNGDHQMKADIATQLAAAMYDAQDVDLIADVPFSAAGLAVETVSRQRKRLFIASGTGADEFTGKFCSPYAMQWTFDSTALARGTAGALIGRGARTFFFMTPDYAFGYSLENAATKLINSAGGRVLGHALFPFGTPDLSSYLLTAQSSGADVIAIAAGPPDNVNAFKQAASFGIGRGEKQQLAAFLAFINDVKATGLELAQGLVITTAFYWDRDDATRAWSQRFYAANGKMPSMTQAGVYSGVLHYLRAVQALGTKDPDAVVKRMQATPINDMFARGGVLRPDGLMVHDLLLVKVKTPAQSKGPWDLYDVLETIPGNSAFPAMQGEGCPLIAG
ncbi:MAG: ABC transporter substrate-binding protein [Acidisphaera sp.]|nr:ABC transporter substrate-binding protein [Acidisphaera sp.]